MNRKWFAIVTLAAAAVALFNLSSCGHSQELVSIQIQPSVQTVGTSSTPVIEDAGAQVQLRALGTYIHPPVTKDITDQVTWASNTPQMFTVNSTGLLTATGESCGGTLVSATVTTNNTPDGLSSSGAIITGYMTANVTCFTGGGTGLGPAVTVAFAGGSGTVSSSPGGLSCTSPNACVDEFAAGTVLTLTATPTAPSTSASWGGTCPTPTSTNVCTFTVEANTTVTASFS
jgi:hypothetical protein